MNSENKNHFFGAIRKVSRAFGTTFSRDELLNLIIDSAIETMNVKAALLFLHDEEEGELVPVAYKGLSAAYPKRGMTHPSKMVPVLEKEGFLFALDAATDPRLDGHQEKQSGGVASLLVVPVKVKGRLIGGLALFTASPRSFSQDEIDFATALAEQGGMAIEHTRLLEKMRHQTKLFLDLAVDINSSLNVKNVLRALTASVADTLKIKGAAVLLVDEETGALECVASSGLSETYLDRGPLYVEGTMQETLEGKLVLIKDVSTDPRVKHKKEKKREGIASLMSVPIKTKDAIIGALRLYLSSPREFTEDEIGLMTALAHLGGIAIQNASMYLMLESDIKDLRQEIWSHRSYF